MGKVQGRRKPIDLAKLNARDTKEHESKGYRRITLQEKEKKEKLRPDPTDTQGERRRNRCEERE